MSIHEQKIVIVCRDQEEPVNVIEVFNALCIGWVDGEPARYFAPIHTSEPYSVVFANSAIGYCRFRDVDSLVAQGYEKRYAKEFVESANRWIIANAHLLPAGQETALHAFDSRRERNLYDD